MIRSFSYHHVLAAERSGYLEEKELTLFWEDANIPTLTIASLAISNTTSIIASTSLQNWHT